jgi:hypothetical protein
MGEKGNAAMPATGSVPSSEGVVAAVVDGGVTVGSGLGDHAAKTVVAIGTERAVEGLLDHSRRADAGEPEGDDLDEQGGPGSTPTSP